jgi:hypothetical protein|nr:MAG TPA: hypothetical protein [Caudoviricetes sp.]
MCNVFLKEETIIVKEEITMKELRKFKKVVFEDYTQYEYNKCWNGGCYSYKDIYTRADEGWNAVYTTSCDLVEPEDGFVDDQKLLYSVNEHIKMVNGVMPFYMDDCFTEMNEKEDKLTFFTGRKDR